MASILVIDDDPNLRDMMHRMLTRAGYDVLMAEEGAEGIETYRKSPTDLVITDLIMPGKEGLETIVDLRREFPDVKIIAISGGGLVGPHDYLNAARGLGATASLSKPSDSRTILATIRETLGEPPLTVKE